MKALRWAKTVGRLGSAIYQAVNRVGLLAQSPQSSETQVVLATNYIFHLGVVVP